MIDYQWASDTANTDLHAMFTAFVSLKIGAGNRGFGECHSMGVFDSDQFIGAVIFHNYEPLSDVIEISAAADSPRWLSRRVLDRIFSYAFDDCRCQMVVARISDENKLLHRIFHAYGFTSYVIPRLRGRNEDERIFTLTDDAWRSGKFFRRA